MDDEPGASREQPVARVVEAEDEDIRLPSPRRAWVISLLLIGLAGLALQGFAGDESLALSAAGFVLGACFLAPLVGCALGHVSLDRAVPFGGALGAVAVIFLNICLNIASDNYAGFYNAGSRELGAVLFLLALAGPPTATILGAVAGCTLANARRPPGDVDDELGL